MDSVQAGKFNKNCQWTSVTGHQADRAVLTNLTLSLCIFVHRTSNLTCVPGVLGYQVYRFRVFVIFLSPSNALKCTTPPPTTSLPTKPFMMIFHSRSTLCKKYEGVSKSFRSGRLEWELQMVQLSATRCSYIAVLWVILVSFIAITLCVASQRLIPNLSAYFFIDSVRKLLDTPS
jgi:hypothetical protein